ncbi:MAG: ArsR/SmtB family transcription factor [Planctomycetota bacterium]|jgi:DNA-binding transcriptional ArsR family regulator
MMRTIINIAKALSDQHRVRALMMLSEGELCVCQLIEMLGLAPSTVSKHMAILHQAGLVDARKEGRWNYYRLPDEDAPGFIIEAIRWVQSSTAKDKRIVRDAKQAKRICKIDRDKLCACYKKEKQKNNKSAVRKRK